MVFPLKSKGMTSRWPFIDAVESVKAIMLGKYKMNDLGKIHLILGCEVLYDEATGDYSMNQRHYVIDLCKKYWELECRRLCQKRP